MASERQIKTTMNATTYLLEQPKHGTPKTPNASKDVKQKEFSYITAKNAKRHTNFER